MLGHVVGLSDVIAITQNGVFFFLLDPVFLLIC